MAKRNLTIRVEQADLERWAGQATKEQRALSDWARLTLNWAVRMTSVGGVVELVDTRPMPAPSSEGVDRGRGGKLMANSPSNAGSSPAPATKTMHRDLAFNEKPRGRKEGCELGMIREGDYCPDCRQRH